MRDKSGGKAIAAGGFGCVFEPALKCKGKSRESGISKVLIKKYAEDEMNEMKNVSNVLTKINNHNDYFVGATATMCELDPLTTDDKLNFNTKCDNLIKKGINESNVNTKLNELRSIDLPYGGLEIMNFLKKYGLTGYNFGKVNTSLIKLLNKAIVPMNNLKLLHLDLKSPNILINDSYQTKIIDWGLSAIQTDVDVIPDAIKNRPFMYNTPFSVCLFNNKFKNFIRTKITNILRTLGKPITSLNSIREDIKLSMYEWIYLFRNDGYSGHYNYISTLFKNEILMNYSDYPKDYTNTINNTEYYEMLNGSYLKNYIVNELTEVVIKYTTVSGDFEDVKFFNEAYKHNVDIWGFLSTYYDILSLCRSGSLLPHKESPVLSHNIIGILNKYLFNPKQQIEPINIEDLSRDLNSLNSLVGYSTKTPSPLTPVSKSVSALLTASIPPKPPTPPLIPGPKAVAYSISSSKSKKISSRVKSSKRIVSPKKTRKRHVTCDDAKKVKCVAMGKVCNEATGRCLAKKK
jgi:hypothetical protein